MATRKHGKRKKVLGGQNVRGQASVDSMRDLYQKEQRKKASGKVFEEETRQQKPKVIKIKVGKK